MHVLHAKTVWNENCSHPRCPRQHRKSTGGVRDAPHTACMLLMHATGAYESGEPRSTQRSLAP